MPALHNAAGSAERETRQGAACAAGCRLRPMETKDTFMRFVVIGSIVVVGALALLVNLKG